MADVQSVVKYMLAASGYRSIVQGFQIYTNNGNPPTNPTLMNCVDTIALSIVLSTHPTPTPCDLFVMFVEQMQLEGWSYGPVDSDKHWTASILKDWDTTSELIRLVFTQLHHVKQMVHA